MDVHTPEQRSHNMTRIRGRDTKPEMLLRRGLHATGLRFRLHGKHLPGRPDLVFPRHSAVVMVHGCFWHGHECPMFRMPATRSEFWAAKIAANRARDLRAFEALRTSDWRVLTVWECAVRGPTRLPLTEVVSSSREFILSDESERVLQGAWGRTHDCEGASDKCAAG